jgi:hypothetical protein
LHPLLPVAAQPAEGPLRVRFGSDVRTSKWPQSGGHAGLLAVIKDHHLISVAE